GLAPGLELPHPRGHVVVAETLAQGRLEVLVVGERPDRRLERTRQLWEVRTDIRVPFGRRGRLQSSAVTVGRGRRDRRQDEVGVRIGPGAAAFEAPEVRSRGSE